MPFPNDSLGRHLLPPGIPPGIEESSMNVNVPRKCMTVFGNKAKVN